MIESEVIVENVTLFYVHFKFTVSNIRYTQPALSYKRKLITLLFRLLYYIEE